MKMTATIGGAIWEIDTRRGIDVSVPMVFGNVNKQSNLYGADPAIAEPWTSGDFVGDVTSGGSCNVASISFIPHCNGTHTECIGHITRETVHLPDVLQPGLIPASLITLEPEAAGSRNESSDPPLKVGEPVITAVLLQKELEHTVHGFHEALVLRTLPNPPEKATMHHGSGPNPCFTIEAMHLLAEMGVRHLLVDLPSVDRLEDDGRMAAHHAFWSMSSDADHTPPAGYARLRTISELLYIPDSLPDGPYVLDLQIPSWQSDAAPSRPVLFPVSR